MVYDVSSVNKNLSSKMNPFVISTMRLLYGIIFEIIRLTESPIAVMATVLFLADA